MSWVNPVHALREILVDVIVFRVLLAVLLSAAVPAYGAAGLFVSAAACCTVDHGLVDADRMQGVAVTVQQECERHHADAGCDQTAEQARACSIDGDGHVSHLISPEPEVDEAWMRIARHERIAYLRTVLATICARAPWRPPRALI